MDELVVGISGINSVDNPGPGVGVARSLKEDKDLNVTVVGLIYDAMETGIYLDWLFDKTYLMPYPSGDHTAFIERLQYVRKSCGLNFVIPNLDAELPLYVKYIEEIKDLGIHLVLPTFEQFKLRGKERLGEVAERIESATPETIQVTSYSELGKSLEKIGLPVMVKGCLYEAFRAHTTHEASSYYHQLVAKWGHPVLLQKVVSGEQLNTVAVGDGEGGTLGLVSVKKLGTSSLGKIWTGVTIKNEKMNRITRNFMSQYKWKGPCEVECLLDDDELILLEINPRLPAWSYFSTGVGVNLPALMVKKALGLPVKVPSGYEAGKLYIRYTYEVITDMSAFQKIAIQGEK